MAIALALFVCMLELLVRFFKLPDLCGQDSWPMTKTSWSARCMQCANPVSGALWQLNLLCVSDLENVTWEGHVI